MALRASPVSAEMVAPIYVMDRDAAPADTERYADTEINPVKLVSEEPVSTFSIDVDTASYGVVRSYLNDGVLPPKDAVRIEELINYFDYDYPVPASNDDPFAISVSLAPSPWAKGRELMQIGVQGYEIRASERPPLNLTLLIDVSGSMSDANKLPLAKQALGLLLDELNANDTLSIVVYAEAAGEVLPPTPASEKRKILAALETLNAGGSTAGGEGLRLAYALAEKSFDKDGVNRVMILTDGDFNVGITSDERLEDFVARKRETGIYLSVMGFGRGNYNDALMQTIAQAGNGTAGYVDTLAEARKLLVDDFAGNMFPIADDVKIQVEFNPAEVAEYRLIGYETRLLNREDFNNDAVDAGEIGSGVSVTAIYEITRVGSDAKLIDDSRYQAPTGPAPTAKAGETAFVKLRYKAPGADTSTLITRPVTDTDRYKTLADAPEATRFASAVAGFGMLLRGDPYTDKAFDYDGVIELAKGASGEDAFGYRAGFLDLARKAKSAAAQAALPAAGVGE
jgi:Ca-activated chloride channel family protein